MKNEILSSIIDLEGGYVNDPSDSGGETMHGITVKVARDHGYFGPMRDLPRSVAMGVYELRYWTPVKGDQLNALSSRVAAEVVDTAINMGTHTASVFLQRSLNVLTKDGVMVDGRLFDRVPRILQSVQDDRGVVFFHFNSCFF